MEQSPSSYQTTCMLEQFLLEEIEIFNTSTRLSQDKNAALKNVGHILLWACALDEHLKKSIDQEAARGAYENILATHPVGEPIQGVRYARNRVAHQFIQCLYTTDGTEFPARFPIPFFEIRWRPNSEFPPADPDHEKKQKHIRQHYITHLENKCVRYIINKLPGLFSDMKQHLPQPQTSPTT